MEATLRVLLIRLSGIHSPLRQGAREVGGGEARRPIGHRPGRLVQQILDEFQIRFPLIRNKRRVLPCETGIVLDRIVLAQFRQIKRPRPV
jgi:hypothetical protein